jgi:hypothetical protein
MCYSKEHSILIKYGKGGFKRNVQRGVNGRIKSDISYTNFSSEEITEFTSRLRHGWNIQYHLRICNSQGKA